MYLLFSIMLTGFHTYKKHIKMMKVVTIRILALFCGYILALLKAVCSPLKKLLATNCYWE